MNKETEGGPPQDTNQIIEERRAKLRALRDSQAVAFPNDFKPRDHAADLLRAAEGLENDALEAAPSFCPLFAIVTDRAFPLNLRAKPENWGSCVFGALPERSRMDAAAAASDRASLP